MIVIMKKNATAAQVKKLCSYVKQLGVSPSPIIGEGVTVIGLVGDTSPIRQEKLELQDGVERVARVQEPYKLANRKFHPQSSQVKVGDVLVGGEQIVIAAGPCAIESEPQINTVSQAVSAAGAQILRGGAFKPRTSPYAFQGLKVEGLMYMRQAARQAGMATVSEITNPTQVELFTEYVDAYQVGARNMQNFELLKELGRANKPVLLKRGFSNTIKELLMSAEYIMSEGNCQVILCERGIRTYETATRNTLDISAVPVLKRLSHLPVFVDPSHSGGIAWLVEPLALAGVAAGADGLIIEVHNDPLHALSDGQQSLTPPEFKALQQKIRLVAEAVGRRL